MTGKLSSLFSVLFGLMLFWANANAELPENVKFCIPKQYTVTYDCPAGGNAPTQQSTAYGNNFTTGVGCNNAPAWRVGDSDTIITSNTTIPYAYTHDIVLHADYSSLYTIAGGKLINADPDVYLESAGTQYIDTGVTPENNIGVYTEFAFSKFLDRAGEGEHIFGSLSPHYYCGITTNSNFACAYGPGAGYAAGLHLPGNIILGEFYKLWFNYNNSGQTILKGGPVDYLYTINYRDFAGNNKHINVFANNNTYFSAVQIRKLQITQDDTLIRHFVPIPRGLRIGDYVVPSNGMWDIIEQQFYPNLGTGEFIYGRG